MPCNCSSGNGDGTGVLDCSDTNLNDDLASHILDLFITPESISLLYRINLENNQLTLVPSQIPIFPQLIYVDLSFNQITMIQTGAFDFSKTVDQLILSNNIIRTIEADAFLGIENNFALNQTHLNVLFSLPGDYGKSLIQLENNLLTRLDSEVFLDLALEMFHYGPYSAGAGIDILTESTLTYFLFYSITIVNF